MSAPSTPAAPNKAQLSPHATATVKKAEKRIQVLSEELYLMNRTRCNGNAVIGGVVKRAKRVAELISNVLEDGTVRGKVVTDIIKASLALLEDCKPHGKLHKVTKQKEFKEDRDAVMLCAEYIAFTMAKVAAAFRQVRAVPDAPDAPGAPVKVATGKQATAGGTTASRRLVMDDEETDRDDE